MAPVAGFVPDIVTNVFKSPFFRRGNKTPRKKTSSDNVSPSPSSPQAGPSDPVVLQSSPRVAMLENHVLSASVESIKEPPAVPPTSFASLDSLASENSLKSRMSNTRMKLEPIIEQPTPSVTPNVSPPHEKPEPSFPTPGHQDSINVFSSPTTIEKPQAHIVNDSPSSRTVTFLTTARAGSMRTGVLFQPFGSPYVPSVDKMNPDGSADMSLSSEDEQSAMFATPPVTPSMASESPTMDSPPAVVLISPSSERGLAFSPSDAFAQSSSPSRLPAPLRTASASTSDTRPSVSSRSSTGYSSETGKSSSLPITPLDAPSDDGQLRSTTVWVGESAIEPIGVPLPTTYAEARNLANAFPEIAEEILKRPLGPSCPSSRATSPSRPAATPSPAPTSDADDADDERSQIHFPTRRREHSPDHPNWALAPDEPQSGRERKRHRGRGRERQNTLDSGATSTRGGGKHRNRRGRGRESGTAVGFERLHAAASVSETEVSPGQVMVETLLRGLKERVQSSPASSTVDADSASPCGRAPYPPHISESEASVAVEKNVSEREAISRLAEARESARAAGSPQRAPRINVPDIGLIERALQGLPKVDSSGSATSVPGRSPTQADSQVAATPVVPERAKETRPRNPRTATVEDATDEDDPRESPVESMPMTAILEMRETREEKPKAPKERETVEVCYMRSNSIPN
ncbi:hypothetical protein DAEQUDRAFT_220237 [Daedalea quercina L-15889]|uniref:Uncharacterized protein n=1 Tax=Daedalea quercina L-15889 TaxID=1314783 RepID=A0A165R6F8_9APHY|nr:hypothetical protein DAEQUDRAFT_220237 [Daedalea quercina L-15889]